MRVEELTGETQADLKLLERGQIILSTPEKWDVLSRRWKQRKNVQGLALFLADELHLIGGEKGPVLEVVVSRMRYISSQVEGSKIRIVGLSSSLANAKDLGEWIGASSHGLFNFPPAVRPVPLDVRIQGYDVSNFEARMQAMAKPAYGAVVSYAVKAGKPALVFVPTRRHARLTALDLITFSRSEGRDQGLVPDGLDLTENEAFKTLQERIREDALKKAVAYGVAYLHEGTSESDREVVEKLYTSGVVQVVVAAASLCWGLSLAAHLVVIMGTQYYDGRASGRADYPISDVLQMMGRASRPNEDEMGRCVILCHAPRKEYYKKFLYDAFPVESHLDHFLHDHLNAEVVVKTVENKQDAVDWLTWTFMYRRLLQNPNYYGLQVNRHESFRLISILIG